MRKGKNSFREGYEPLTGGRESNFLVQIGTSIIKDGNGRVLGMCDQKGVMPIRGIIENNSNKIVKILCGKYGICESCPFEGRVEKDTTDFLIY